MSDLLTVDQCLARLPIKISERRKRRALSAKPRWTDRICASGKMPEGFVYLAENTDRPFVKVGFAGDMTNRIASLNTSSADDIHLLEVFRGCKQDERRIHDYLKRHRHRREWFRAHDDVYEFIDDVFEYQLGEVLRETPGLAVEAALEAAADVPLCGFWQWEGRSHA